MHGKLTPHREFIPQQASLLSGIAIPALPGIPSQAYHQQVAMENHASRHIDARTLDNAIHILNLYHHRPQ